jgi:hypothetical protein
VDPRSPFLIRRVLAGVLAGLVLLALGFFGWSRYRTAQYHHRESTVVARYHAYYRQCLTLGPAASACAERVFDSCTADAFWSVAQPFALGFDGGFSDGPSEASLQCKQAPVG